MTSNENLTPGAPEGKGNPLDVVHVLTSLLLRQRTQMITTEAGIRAEVLQFLEQYPNLGLYPDPPSEDDTGPAFPVPADAQWEGMTTREYFATRAPAEPQPWFRPAMPPKPNYRKIPDPMDKDGNALTPEMEDRARQWFRDPVGDAEDEYRLWGEMALDMRRADYDAIDAWARAHDAQRYIQWPWAWADAVLASANGENVQ